MPGTLRVAFDVTKTWTSQPNRLVCRIYNLNRDSRAWIDSPGNIITVRAGYADDVPEDDDLYSSSLPIISRADVTHSFHRRTGADFITTIQGGEGEVGYRVGFVNEKMEPGISIEKVFDRLKDTFEEAQAGVIAGTLVDRGFSVVPFFDDVIKKATVEAKAKHLAKTTASYSKYFMNGLTLYGFARDIMDKLAERHDLIWFFDNNVLTVSRIRDALEVVDSAPWGPNNGVQGIPQRLENKSIKVTNNLTPVIMPWSEQTLKMQIDTNKTLNGKYKVYRVQHTGDTDPSGLWTSKWEAFGV